MKKIIIAIAIIAFMVSNGYCQEMQPDAQVSIKTDKVKYVVGEELIVTITNNSDRLIIHYGICSITICEHGERGWFCSEKDCYSPKKTVLPGGSIEFRDKVNAPYQKGAIGTHINGARQRYKFEYYEDSKPGIKTIFSNEFTVKPE